ncbi:MAG TPA: PadR family transcriptional regulator [Rhizomicrobium sp.]|jgi:DNA-binding PadR family transcriptional regulator|nr:PadR family transcriptional regulator [Rhizomicrobium sp.]
MWHSRNHEESNGYRHCGPRGGRFAGGFGRFAGGRGDGSGGHGRRRGLYDSEELRLVLLSLIGEQARHGYDLIREIEERTGGAYAPSPGIVYPTLTMLQDMGLIAESETPGTRKVYALTPEGTSYLKEHREAADALLARIAELGSVQKGDRAPVRRALRNLYGALAEKVARADNDELMHRIAALLDEVTQKIERS